MKRKYICGWCGYIFSQEVNYQGIMKNPHIGQSNPNQGKGSAGSTIVKCPNCARLIPTWQKEMTGNVVGRKHIHLR